MNFLTDSFTGSIALLSAHNANSPATPWTCFGGTPDAVSLDGSGAILGTVDPTDGSQYFHPAVPPSADYEINAELVLTNSGTSQIVFGVLGRVNEAEDTFYVARYNTNAGNKFWELYAFKPGIGNSAVGYVQLGTYAQVLTVNQVYKLTLRMVGSAITLLVDGIVRISVTDTNVIEAGKVGIQWYSAQALYLKMNALEGTDLGVVAPPPPPPGTLEARVTSLEARVSALEQGGTGVPAPVIMSADSTYAHEDQPFKGYQIVADGTPTSYGATGLPTGLSINTSTGVISGTPTGYGGFSVTLQATNSGGVGTKNLNIIIHQAKGWCWDSQIAGCGADLRDVNNEARSDCLLAGCDITGIPISSPTFGGRLLSASFFETTAHIAPGYVDFFSPTLGTIRKNLNTVDCYEPLNLMNDAYQQDIIIWRFRTALPSDCVPLRHLPQSIQLQDLNFKNMAVISLGGQGTLAKVIDAIGWNRKVGLKNTDNVWRLPLSAGNVGVDGTSGTHIVTLFDDGVTREAVSCGLMDASAATGLFPDEYNALMNRLGNPGNETISVFSY